MYLYHCSLFHISVYTRNIRHNPTYTYIKHLKNIYQTCSRYIRVRFFLLCKDDVVIKKRNLVSILTRSFSGGKRGIRTPGPVKINGFQDRRIRPLCHLSVCKDTNFFHSCKIFFHFIFYITDIQENIFSFLYISTLQY